jgi:UDP-glucose 4-epimerase
MKVLVTGGAGFIGSHIVDGLVAGGHEVTVLDDLSTGRIQNVHPSAAFVQADITAPNLPRILGGRSFDAVIHHAAQVSVSRSIDDPVFDAQVNFVGTVRLLDFCCTADVKRFIFASSAAVYGEPRSLPVGEDTPTNPLSPYAVSKLAAEEHLRYFRCRSGMQIVVLRYANVYGPRQNVRGEAGVVCAFMHHILTGRPAEIHGDGLQTRDFICVDDVVQANLLALQPDAPAGVYNVGSGQATSILELHRLLAGPHARYKRMPARPGDIRHSVLDSSAARSALGWQPKVPLLEGLVRTWQYFFSRAKSPAPAYPTAEPRSSHVMERAQVASSWA